MIVALVIAVIAVIAVIVTFVVIRYRRTRQYEVNNELKEMNGTEPQSKQEDHAPASSKTDSDTPLLVLDVDNKKEDDSTARSRIEYLVPDPGRQHPYHVPSQRPTAPTSRKHTVFLEYPTKPKSEDDNFYVGDQQPK